MAKKALRLIAALLAFALVAAACGGDDDGGGSDTTVDPDALKVIRFAFAPDPVWDYLNDSGLREQMETDANIAILDSATWNEVGIYAGGNADIMSVGDFEVPTIEQEFNIPSVIFGKYNIDRSIAVASPDHPEYTTLEDCKGGTVAVWDTLSSTTIWGVLADQLYDLDFRVDGGDFELVVVDHTNTVDQAANGSTDCALVLPDFAVPFLSANAVNVLYDGKTSADLYAELVEKPGHEGPMINIFLAREDWYADHPEEVAFFLALWEAGVKAWAADRDQFVADYPEHFAVETDEQIAWIQDYVAQHDWFVESVYLDQSWIDSETELFGFLNEAGLSDTSDPPTYDIVTP
ncbi:MAG: ABC transporter substrate-binding protein [Acidimicrobiia bacterium]|nr:ABC transporter substrate-binding protein [Acidimicrobiia bacterium]